MAADTYTVYLDCHITTVDQTSGGQRERSDYYANSQLTNASLATITGYNAVTSASFPGLLTNPLNSFTFLVLQPATSGQPASITIKPGFHAGDAGIVLDATRPAIIPASNFYTAAGSTAFSYTCYAI